MHVHNMTVKKGKWTKWLWWSKSEEHEFKLNVDGSRKGAASAGGGVVCNRHGEFVCGFSAPYAVEDIVEAEIHALVDDLELCRRQGSDRVCVESDSTVVVTLINDSSQNNWRYAYLSRNVKSRLRFNEEARFIYREQNKVADSLAKAALGQTEKEYFSRQELSPNIQKLIFLDRIVFQTFVRLDTLFPC